MCHPHNSKIQANIWSWSSRYLFLDVLWVSKTEHIQTKLEIPPWNFLPWKWSHFRKLHHWLLRAGIWEWSSIFFCFLQPFPHLYPVVFFSISFLSPPPFFFFLIYLLLSPLSYSSLSYHYLSSVTTPGLSSTHTAARMIFLKPHVIRPMPLALMDPVAVPSPIPASLWPHPGLLSSTSPCLGQLAFLQFSECIMSFVHSS